VPPYTSIRKKWLFTAAKLLILALVVWAVRRTLLEGLAQLDEHPWHLSPGWLLAAGGLYLAGLFPAGLYWYWLLKRLGQDVRPMETLRAYYIGHLGKYVPGKAMVVVLRAGLIRSHRVDTTVAALSVFVETLTMMSTGAVLAAAILSVWFRQETFLCLMAVALGLLAGLPTLPPVFRRLARLAGVGKASSAAVESLGQLRYGTLFLGWIAMTIGWALLGLSLWATLRAMGVTHLELGSQWPRYLASVSLAMVAGFLSLIPGGVVVREAVLAGLMAPRFGDAVALVSAVVLRLVWLVSELVISGILYIAGASRPP